VSAVPKPERNTSQREYREKAITTAKKIIRLAGVCEKCGRTEKKYQMQGVHIIPVRFGSTAADLDNLLCLCGFCHTADNDSAHLNEIEFHGWLDEYHPGRRERLKEKSRHIFKGCWVEIYESLLKKYHVMLQEKLLREGIEQ